MADAKTVGFLEDVYARVDTMTRDIVRSMLPDVSVAAQDDGDVVANAHRILNFTGDGVTVADDPARRRVNIFIPGAPASSSTTTVVGTAGLEKIYTLSGGSIGGAPSNWQTTGFSDSGWSNSVQMTANISGSYVIVPGSQWVSDFAGNVTAPAGMLMRRTFSLPAGSVVSAVLTINVDDDIGSPGQLYINGTSLASSFVRSVTTPITYASINVSPVLLTPGGSNVLAVFAHDPNVGPTPHAVSYSLIVDMSGAGADAQYQLVSEKDQPDGYAGLDSDGLIDNAELADTGTPSSTTFLRGDHEWATISTASITVKDIDGTPSVTATTIEFPNGSITDQTGGVARYTPGTGSSASSNLASDTTLATGGTNLVNVSLGVGTWIVWGGMHVVLTTSTATTVIELWDGTSAHYGSAGQTTTGGQNASLSVVSEPITIASGTLTVHLRGIAQTASNATAKATTALGGTVKSTWIRAMMV